MKIIIRVDSSSLIGIGHAMRCLALANELRETGNEITFICRDLPENINSIIKENHFPLIQLTNRESTEININNEISELAEILQAFPKSDWLIVDTYVLDATWHKAMYEFADKIMVIDDLANRYYYCDILIDQNFYLNLEERYFQLVPQFCKLYLGPRYAILRPEFMVARQECTIPRNEIKNILIFFGGSDASNETEKALRAFIAFNHPEIQATIVVGKANSNARKLHELCKKHANTRYCYNTKDMAKLMQSADLALGAAGTATWERCCVGLPSIVAVLADNQAQVANDGTQIGVLYNLGNSDITTENMYMDAIDFFMRDLKSLTSMSQKAAALVDGKGISRIVKCLRES